MKVAQDAEATVKACAIARLPVIVVLHSSLRRDGIAVGQPRTSRKIGRRGGRLGAPEPSHLWRESPGSSDGTATGSEAENWPAFRETLVPSA